MRICVCIYICISCLRENVFMWVFVSISGLVWMNYECWYQYICEYVCGDGVRKHFYVVVFVLL